jgi:hypothetical protein
MQTHNDDNDDNEAPAELRPWVRQAGSALVMMAKVACVAIYIWILVTKAIMHVSLTPEFALAAIETVNGEDAPELAFVVVQNLHSLFGEAMLVLCLLRGLANWCLRPIVSVAAHDPLFIWICLFAAPWIIECAIYKQPPRNRDTLDRIKEEARGPVLVFLCLIMTVALPHAIIAVIFLTSDPAKHYSTVHNTEFVSPWLLRPRNIV